MPSGAKKRKAAKKKKEIEANFTSLAHGSQGNEDVKSQDGKRSGSKEVDAPALYHHHNCRVPLNGNSGELEKNGASSVESIAVEDESLCMGKNQRNEETERGLGFEGNCIVEVVNEMISAENCDSKSIIIEDTESGNKFFESDDENITSSSDDLLSIPDKKIVENYLPADAILINKSTTIRESINPLVERVMVAESMKSNVSLPKETICSTKTEAVENAGVSGTIVSRLKRDADKLLSNPGDGTRPSVTYPDSVPKENEDKDLALSGENDKVSSSVMEHGSKYLEGKTRLSSNAPVNDSDKSDAIANNSEIAKCFKNQTSAPARLMVQRTSLFGCCGLFDLLKGSNG